MRALSPALQAVLSAGGPFVVADLYTITLITGTVLHWTSGIAPITVGGVTYDVGPPISREKVSWSLGLSLPTMKMTLLDDGSTLINGQQIVVAAWKSIFDYAVVRVDRFISDSWSNTTVGSIDIFDGKVGDMDVQGKAVHLTIESTLSELRGTFPHSYVLPACSNALYDSICGLARSAFTLTGTVGAGATANTIPLSGVTQPDGYFALGIVTFSSGENSGEVRQIKDYIGGVITLGYPLYAIPATGDAVSVVAGCDKTRATCSGRFNNLAHFRGFPYVPAPSTQYQGTASDSGGADGGGSGGAWRGGYGPARGHRGAGGGVKLR